MGTYYYEPDVMSRQYSSTSGSYSDLDRFNRVVTSKWTKDLATDKDFYKVDLDTEQIGRRKGFYGVDNNNTSAYQANWLHIFTPALLNEFSYGQIRVQGSAGDSPGIPFRVPDINITYQNTGINAGWGPATFIQHNYNWRDVVTWVRGSHSLKFGGEVWMGDDDARFRAPYERPSFVFNNLLDLGRIEEIIKGDIALSCGLLRYLNSAALGLGHRIDSIRQAIVMLGDKQLRRWGALVSISALGQSKPHQLLITSLVRARFCEHLADILNLQDRALDMYLVGLLSTMDAVLDMPMITGSFSSSGPLTTSVFEPSVMPTCTSTGCALSPFIT